MTIESASPPRGRATRSSPATEELPDALSTPSSGGLQRSNPLKRNFQRNYLQKRRLTTSLRFPASTEIPDLIESDGTMTWIAVVSRKSESGIRSECVTPRGRADGTPRREGRAWRGARRRGEITGRSLWRDFPRWRSKIVRNFLVDIDTTSECVQRRCF